MSTTRPLLGRCPAHAALYTYGPEHRPCSPVRTAPPPPTDRQCRVYGADAPSRYPTPPHTTSPPHSNASTPDSSDEHMHRSSPKLAQAVASYFPDMTTPRSPVSPTPHVPIIAIQGSRSPTEDQRTQPEIQVSPTAYSMVAHIGSGFHPECITISAKKGNSLVIVADRWDMEKDCRYEWLWRFDRDADMSSVHANYDAGVLRVTVKRIPGYN